MNDTVLVTAVYNANSGWYLGGRSNFESMYVTSLRNLASLNLPTVIFCWPHMEERLRELVEPFFSDVEIVGCDLFTYPRSYDVLKLKPEWVTVDNENGKFIFAPRCELLCHWKLKWCSLANKSVRKYDKVVWIDAGVTEWCKIPLCYGGAEFVEPNMMVEQYPESHYYPENKDNIFTPAFTEGVKRVMNDREWFFIAQSTYNDALSEFDSKDYDYLLSKIVNKTLERDDFGNTATNRKTFTLDSLAKLENVYSSPYPAWTVGTIFGGSIEYLDNEIIPMYDKLYHAFTDETVMRPFTEEPIYSLIASYKDLNAFYFTDWNHGMADQPVFYGHNKKPFFSIINDITNY